MPGDALVGQFRKGQGLLVHVRDCVTLRKQRVDAERAGRRRMGARCSGRVRRRRARCWSPTGADCSPTLATAIGDADANIDTVSMERPDGGDVAMFFGVQVRDRRHLAHVMRALQRVPDVRKVARART